MPSYIPSVSPGSPNCSAGYFKFWARFLKNLHILRTKQDKFVKQKAFFGEGKRIAQYASKML
jgi:hypothetical protein